MDKGRKERRKKFKKVFDDMLENDPAFRKFEEENREKTLEELALEYDLDLDMLRHCF